MPQWESLAAFGRELYGLEGDLTVKEVRQITRAQGVEAQKIAANAARVDLGSDRAFSGWRRRAPIPLDTQLRQARDGATLLTPGKAAGQWTTAERGRNTEGGVGLFQGPGVNLKSGSTMRDKAGNIKITRRRARKARRNNGVTKPMHTASDARAVMEAKLPKIAAKAVLVVTRKRFTVT